MNKELNWGTVFFDNEYEELLKILHGADLSEREKKYRIDQIDRIYEDIKRRKRNDDYNAFLQRAHEIRSFQFLRNIGQLIVASDSNHTPGPDFILEGIYVECVCSTLGDVEKTGLANYLKYNVIIDYKEKNQLLKERLISSISGKVNCYYEHVGKKVIEKNRPYIIFLSLGRLSMEWFPEENGIALTEILFGRGNPRVIYDNTTDEIVGMDYSHEDLLIKHNGAELDCNLFLSNEYKCVSAIMLATECGAEYSSKNIFLFLNPFANNKVDSTIFHGITIWDRDESGIIYKPISETKRQETKTYSTEASI